MMSTNFCDYLKIACTFGLILMVLVQQILPISGQYHHSTLSEDFAKAFEHGARVRMEGACRNPHPMIIYQNKTDPSKVYLPRGTVLHRCSDLTGCCQNPAQSCGPIEMQTVELYFITLTLHTSSESLHRHRRVRKSPRIEKFLFTNHTLCGCKERNSNSNKRDVPEEEIDAENEI